LNWVLFARSEEQGHDVIDTSHWTSFRAVATILEIAAGGLLSQKILASNIFSPKNDMRTPLSELDSILEFNRHFVASKKYKYYTTDK
jgi:hypothetical protein